MSIESVHENENTSHRPSTSLEKAVRPLQPLTVPPTRYSDLLLNDMSMMVHDVDTWSRSSHYASQPPSHLSGPPAMLTRHMSMPGRPMPPMQYPSSFEMNMPVPLSRHQSQGFMASGYQAAMNVPMPPRQVHVNEMQHLLEISLGNQQPLQYPMSSHSMIKSAMNVEPISFTSTDRTSKLAMDDIDPLTYVIFDNSTTSLKSEPLQELHPLESAFDSLDRLLPEMEREMLFRMPEMDQLPHNTIVPKCTTKSPKNVAMCKVTECQRRVRSKGFCKSHGGGRKCSIEGCKKSSQNGDFCIGHGGGKKCKEDGCAKAAQSHGLCKAHGGGARCKFLDCNKSSQGGGLCRAHGGGKRCQAAGCPKGAQRGNFCATHGGFRNCKIEGCVRTDRGGGFCEVHRRGRLCKVKGCKKLSRNQGMCTMHIREDKQVVHEADSSYNPMTL
ncbi:uncharacterized protein PHALS_05671 [Plasmopara halstedii]|uniref:WRKY19-like zinc finger domain-containing protein n=1 Tax=Plasmopara halstedii TaxID=4781 RepID=A0A0P1B2R6_PLAHL|nr:uncharacterized protein PHALS_05671 [Plasmopara halstedii]CEG48201.1 hypothetical protein PHALS_05671 [Plasmopara halstedii]|eukprot:XP_024584570.1 hypothetical protein PHALS_05671 [Plasmopara halstedii]